VLRLRLPRPLPGLEDGRAESTVIREAYTKKEFDAGPGPGLSSIDHASRAPKVSRYPLQ